MDKIAALQNKLGEAELSLMDLEKVLDDTGGPSAKLYREWDMLKEKCQVLQRDIDYESQRPVFDHVRPDEEAFTMYLMGRLS